MGHGFPCGRVDAFWRRHALEVSTQDTTYLMCADTEKEKDDWIGAIGRAIVRCSATFTNDDGMDGASDDD